jgi:hypothetical protein
MHKKTAVSKDTAVFLQLRLTHEVQYQRAGEKEA